MTNAINCLASTSLWFKDFKSPFTPRPLQSPPEFDNLYEKWRLHLATRMRKLYNITIKSDNFLDLVNKIIVRRSEVIYHGQKRNIKRKTLSVFYAQLPNTISKCWWYPGMAYFSSPTRIRNFISIRGNNWFPDRPSCHRLTDSSHILECEECGLTWQLGGCWHIGGQLGLAMATSAWPDYNAQYNIAEHRCDAAADVQLLLSRSRSWQWQQISWQYCVTTSHDANMPNISPGVPIMAPPSDNGIIQADIPIITRLTTIRSRLRDG